MHFTFIQPSLIQSFNYLSANNKKKKRFEETEEQKPDDAFREVITSCRSLSTYEPNNLKSALPQVLIAITLFEVN